MGAVTQNSFRCRVALEHVPINRALKDSNRCLADDYSKSLVTFPQYPAALAVADISNIHDQQIASLEGKGGAPGLELKRCTVSPFGCELAAWVTAFLLGARIQDVLLPGAGAVHGNEIGTGA